MERVEWLIVFESGKHVLAPWLKEGFGHCFAATPQAGAWIIVNPAYSHTQVAAVDDEELSRLIGKNTYKWAVANPEGYRTPGLFTCVDMIKSLLGISSPFVLTPYQLYRHLDGRFSETRITQGQELNQP